MSTDHDFDHDPDPGFEQDLRARLGAAAEPVTGAGVTMASVEARVAARRPARRRRQGAAALAAAAIVVLGGVGLAAAVGGDGQPERTRLASEGDPSGTEAPTTAAPTTECTLRPTTTVTLPAVTAAAPEEGPGPVCDDVPSPPTAEPPSTTTTETTAHPSTSDAPAPTTQPAGWPGAECVPGSHEDCIDPEGDGSHVWLIGGGDCMASPTGGPACADLDGDGQAGYPDHG